MNPTRVLIVDDHAVVREGIRTVLAADPEFAVTGEASNGREAIERVAADRPDVVLLDLSMPVLSGLDAVPLLCRAAPAVRILMLSVYDDAEYIMKAIRTGAHGYVRKDTSPEELREAIRAVRRGEGFFSPGVAGRLADALRRDDEAVAPRPPAEVLTAREREVLAGVARGELNKEIAARLRISVRTVEAHRENLSRKLGIRSAAALTRYALEHGLAGAPPEPRT